MDDPEIDQSDIIKLRKYTLIKMSHAEHLFMKVVQQIEKKNKSIQILNLRSGLLRRNTYRFKQKTYAAMKNNQIKMPELKYLFSRRVNIEVKLKERISRLKEEKELAENEKIKLENQLSLLNKKITKFDELLTLLIN